MARATFSKSDLVSGMVVEYRNGKRRTVILGCAVNPDVDKCDMLVGPTGERSTWLHNFNENLTHESKEELDIVAVYTQPFYDMRDFNCDINGDELNLIWKRRENKLSDMTLGELARMLGQLDVD